MIISDKSDRKKKFTNGQSGIFDVLKIADHEIYGFI